MSECVCAICILAEPINLDSKSANTPYTIHYIVAAQCLLSFCGANFFRVDPHAPICGFNPHMPNTTMSW